MNTSNNTLYNIVQMLKDTLHTNLKNTDNTTRFYIDTNIRYLQDKWYNR